MFQVPRRVFGRLAVQVALGSMLVILIVGILLVSRLDHIISKNEEDRIHAELIRASERFAVQFQIHRDFALLSTVWLASLEQVRGGTAAGQGDRAVAAVREAYQRVSATLGSGPSIALFDPQGGAMGGDHDIGADPPASVRHVLQTGMPVAGVIVDPVLGPAVGAVSPVIAPDGSPAGVLELAFPVEARLIGEYLANARISVTFVLDDQPLVTSAPDLADSTGWPALQAGNLGTVATSSGETYLVSGVAAPAYDGFAAGSFYIAIPELVIVDGVASARRELIAVTGGAILLATLLTFGVAWLTTRPVSDLLAGARRIQENELDDPVRASGSGEIRALGDAMEDMRIAIRQSRESLLSANRELASRVDLSASNLADATNELVTVHQVLARLEEAPTGDLSGVASALADLEWVDGVVIALRSRDGRLAVAASTRLTPGATVDLIDVINLKLEREPFPERWEVPVTLDEPQTARLATRRIGGFAVELIKTSDAVAGFAAVTAVQRFNLTPQRDTVLRAVAREVSLNLERRQLEEEVEENRRIAESVLREMSDGVLVVDHRGVCRICNPAAARLLGRRPEEVIGREASYYLPLSGEIIERMRARTAEFPDTATAPVVAEQSGLRIAVTASLYPDAESTEDGMILLLRDLTTEAEIERVRRDFVSIVGHELRTPLTLIRTSADLLLEGDAGELNETQSRLAGVLRNNSDRMTRLINDLVDIASLDPGRLDIRPGWVDLSETVQEVVESLAADAEARRHEVRVDVPERTIVWADQSRVRQVLTNLLSNAIKYTPAEGLVNVTVSDVPDMVEVAVADNGIGIKPEEQLHLFERFYRAPGGRRMSGGAGLGLPIARALIELHGGTIRSESDGESGSTFIFTLPRQPLGSD